MNIRTRFGFFLLKCIRLLYISVPIVLSPESLIELNRLHFGRRARREIPLREIGLYQQEHELLNHLGIQSGEALCLGSGAGREVFALARRGLKVLGVDQVGEFIRFATEYAKEHHLQAEFVEQEITQFEGNGRKFDHIFMLNFSYSYLPSRRLRVELLTRLRGILRPEGRCILNFLAQAPSPAELRRFHFLRALGSLVRGNRHFEIGDRMEVHDSFMHFFPSHDVVGTEGQEAGFTQIELFVSSNKIPYAILHHDSARSPGATPCRSTPSP